MRGLLSFYDDTPNDLSNPFDDVDSYGILNLYVGLRDQSGAWEVSLYGKNIAETERATTRDQSAVTTSYREQTDPSPLSAVSRVGTTNYRRVTYTDPREFGINVRYSFGSR